MTLSKSKYLDPLPFAGRIFRSAIPSEALQSIQRGTLTNTYKGVPFLKNPFDVTLYAQLIWREKPKTIIEIGSFKGGSALWFADQMATFGISPNVISIDIIPITNVVQKGVRFLTGDARNLSQVLSPDVIVELPHPWFVVEDSNHVASTCLAILDFFHEHLRTGEYIAVEDGIVTDLEIADSLEGGPSCAVSKFLTAHPDCYEIDTSYCDHYGYNFTYNVNGYLRRR